MARPKTAVLFIHGMGEQRPLETLRGGVAALLASFRKENQAYHSRPTTMADSYEARRFIVPAVFAEQDPDDPSAVNRDRRPQLEAFEYHWAHHMQGNRLDDLASTFRRIMFTRPWHVPGGILGLWLLLWGALLAAVWGVTVGPLSHWDLGNLPANVLAAVAGTGALSMAITWLLTRALPSWVTGSFVDVVRYLDTSPRSLQVRTRIRAGAIELLRDLNDEYDRVIIVAHSLGSYIAYDALRYLWATTWLDYDRNEPPTTEPPDGLVEFEQATLALGDGAPTDAGMAGFQAAQDRLRAGLADQGRQWRVTDLVTLGSPMYMADKIYTRSRGEFDEAVAHQEFPTCPPQEDHPKLEGTSEDDLGQRLNYSFEWWVPGTDMKRRYLSDGAPFAAIRWTNIWFPTRLLFFGDWFAGPLAPLFGNGIRDVPIAKPSFTARIPGYAHTRYYKDVATHPDSELATTFEEVLALRFSDAGNPRIEPG